MMTQYEARFQMLYRYATAILQTKEEQIYYFVHGLRSQLRMGTHLLVTLGRSYLDIVDHVYSIE